MEWSKLTTQGDIDALLTLYHHFVDSLLVRFSFESGNYVDSKRVSHEYNENRLHAVFERLDNNPFSIELLFEQTRQLNCMFPCPGRDNWTAGILFAKIVRNDEFFYWTTWQEFDPYKREHLAYHDFPLIEAREIEWRVVE